MARDVVDGARDRAVEEPTVGLHDVRDVQEVADGGEIAHAHHRLASARRDLGYLAREARGDERVRLTRTGMVERADAHHVEPVFSGECAQLLRRGLAARIGRAGPHGGGLGVRAGARARRVVLVGRADQ